MTNPQIIVIASGDIVRRVESYQQAERMAANGGRIFVEVTAPVVGHNPHAWPAPGGGLSDEAPLKTATRAICDGCGGIATLTACSGVFWTDCCNRRME